MLSGVSGLLTFTMVSDDVLETTSELPSSVHDMIGCGFPVTLQVNVMLSPSFTVCLVFLIVIDGGSTTVILTVALSPVPTVLTGTQVKTPSAITVVLNTTELLLPTKLSFKKNW